MSDKLIWSNNMTQDYLCSLPEESLRAVLPDYGYEEDMLDGLDYEGLKQLVMDDDYLWQNDSEEFEYSIAPEIAKQTRDGIVLLSGTAGRWDGNRNAGLAVQVEDLVGGDICKDCDKIAIYEDEHHNLYWEASHHDGTHVMRLFALPEAEDRLVEFVKVCMPDAIDDAMDYGYDDIEQAIEDVVMDIDNDISSGLINDYCDFSKVPEVCEPIQADMNLHIEGPATTGEPIDVYKDESLEEGAFKVGDDIIFDNPSRPNVPHVAKVQKVHRDGTLRTTVRGENNVDPKRVIKHNGKNIDEAKSKNPETLAMEVQSIKDDYEDFGPEGFYAVPFKRFESQYPEFTKSCIRTYLKELEILEPEELEDPEIFEQYWQTGELIIPEDWPILIDGAERLSSDRADKGYTWITLLKKHQRPFDEPENESLTEAANLTVPATINDLGEYETYLQGRDLQDYGFYQGDVILDNEYDSELVDKIKSAGLTEGDEVLVKLKEVDDGEFPYRVVDVILNTDESLTEASKSSLVPWERDKYTDPYDLFVLDLTEALLKTGVIANSEDVKVIKKGNQCKVSVRFDNNEDDEDDAVSAVRNFNSQKSNRSKVIRAVSKVTSDYKCICKKASSDDFGYYEVLDISKLTKKAKNAKIIDYDDYVDLCYNAIDHMFKYTRKEAFPQKVNDLLANSYGMSKDELNHAIMEELWGDELNTLISNELGINVKPYDEHGESWQIIKNLANESLTESKINENFLDDLIGEILPEANLEEAEVAIEQPQPQVDCKVETATNVMAAYQNANKWLDIVKEAVYTNMGCVFFSSFIHNLAHTMPGRFDKFGDILHTVNMKIPYPPTAYIPNEPTTIDEVFGCIFMVLDAIKTALNEFIRCTDETAHGMACAAEGLLNDIEGEYPMLFRLQQEWANCNGDMATFDKYVGQFVEHKDELLQ